MPLTRRIDNQKVIEQASIIRAINKENLNSDEIGNEIAKYLQLRLNTIETKSWEVKYSPGKLLINKN